MAGLRVSLFSAKFQLFQKWSDNLQEIGPSFLQINAIQTNEIGPKKKHRKVTAEDMCRCPWKHSEQELAWRSNRVLAAAPQATQETTRINKTYSIITGGCCQLLRSIKETVLTNSTKETFNQCHFLIFLK